MTYTLPTFFAEWVDRGIGEWMDLSGVSCIPKIRVAEVEVAVVCAYYGLPLEVASLISRLAFSNHLPKPILTDLIITNGYTYEEEVIQVHYEFDYHYYSFFDPDDQFRTGMSAPVIASIDRHTEEENSIDGGRINSIWRCQKSMVDMEEVNAEADIFDLTEREINEFIGTHYDKTPYCKVPTGKERNDMRNYIETISGTTMDRAETYCIDLFDEDEKTFYDLEVADRDVRPFRRVGRGTWYHKA